MKRFTMILMTLVVMFCLTGIARATTITTTNSGSSVYVSDNAPFANINASLDDINSTFDLAQGESATFDFFNLTAVGIGGGKYTVKATLAFTDPSDTSITGNGSGKFATFFGIISGGTLNWSDMPQTIIYGNDGILNVDFEDGCAITCGCGGGAQVKATITNVKDSTTVPEPATFILFGSTLVGLAGFGRKSILKK